MSFSGMGGSDWRSFYTRDTFVDDVWGVVKDTGMENPIVVGHSFGGMVSLITASKHSQDMSGLLLVDFVVNKPEEHHEWYEGRAPARPPRIVKEKEELVKRFRLMPPQQCINQYLVDYIADHSIRETEKGWAWTFDPSAYDGLIIGSDHSKILSELNCPVGFYYGENTIEFKEGELKTMKDLLPEDSPIFGLKDAQHHLMLDQPLPFIENLDRLIQELLTKSS
jgi:pimeloyl-ACP methyl ester carboxylesterase